MSFVPALRLLLATALAALVVFGSPNADAQLGGGLTVSFNTQSLDRSKKPLRGQGQFPFGISYQDCLDDNRLELQVTLSSLPDSRIEVWASRGAACSNPDERNISGECWAVYSARPDELVWNISLSPRNIVAGYRDPDLRRVENADVSVCQAEIGSGGADGLTFYIMVVEGEQVLAQATPWKTVVDVERPAPPEQVSADPGEDRLIVKWGKSRAQDRQSYRIFCELAGGADDAGSDDASSGVGGTSGGTGSGGTSGGTGDDAGALDGAASDASADASALVLTPLQLADGSAGTGGAEGGTGGDGGTGTAGGGGEGGEEQVPEVPSLNASCPSPALVQPNPPGRYRCGSATANADEGEATGLTNGRLYAVAVATVDKLGNVGPLSEIECGSPKPVTDFFEAYRSAGGDAGGGFCAIGRSPQSGALVFMLGALVMWIVRRRRTR